MSDHVFSAEDHLEVINLIARYSRALDSADIEAFLDLYRPDAVIDSMSGMASGIEELRAWMIRLLETRNVGARPSKLIHFIGVPIVRGAGERATAETYTLIVDYTAEGELRLPLLGRYEDELVRVDDRWWIQRRTIHGELSRPADA